MKRHNLFVQLPIAQIQYYDFQVTLIESAECKPLYMGLHSALVFYFDLNI